MRGPFIRGVVVALLLGLVIVATAGFRRAGISFDYDIESETKTPDGSEVKAHWSGNGSERGGSRHYETDDEDGSPLDIFSGRAVTRSVRHHEVESRGNDDEIEGYRTRRYRVTETDTLWIEGADSPATARIVIDYWMTPKLDRVAEPVLTFADSVIRSRIGIEEPRQSGHYLARELRLRGTPLRIVADAVLIDPDGKRWESQMTSELSDISRRRGHFSFSF